MELEFLMKLEIFLGNFRFTYQGNGHLEDALESAVCQADYQMGLQGEKLRTGLGKKREDMLFPNRYLQLFFVLCRIHERYGEEDSGNNSFFLKNISFLKEEIGKEYLRRKKLSHAFTGLFAIMAVTFAAMKWFEMWAIASVENIGVYYTGKLGRALTVFVSFSILFIWYMLLKLRFAMQTSRKGLAGMLREQPVLHSLSIWMINCRKRHYQKLHRLLLYVGYPGDCIEFLLRQAAGAVFGSVGFFFAFMGIFGRPVWVVGAGMLAGMYLGSLMPYADIVLCRIQMDVKKDEEILRFQTLLLLLCRVKGMSVEIMAEWLAKTAEFFKETIEGAAGRMEARGRRIFDEMEKEADYAPFNRIIETFRSCDEVPFETAFGDMETERQYYIEKTTQERNVQERNAEILGTNIAFLPAFLVVAVKLVIPFMLQGLSLLSSYLDGVNGI